MESEWRMHWLASFHSSKHAQAWLSKSIMCPLLSPELPCLITNSSAACSPRRKGVLSPRHHKLHDTQSLSSQTISPFSQADMNEMIPGQIHHIWSDNSYISSIPGVVPEVNFHSSILCNSCLCTGLGIWRHLPSHAFAIHNVDFGANKLWT